jgi:hypothetical protein
MPRKEDITPKALPNMSGEDFETIAKLPHDGDMVDPVDPEKQHR